MTSISSKRVRTTLGLVAAAGLAITSAYFGARVGLNYKQNHLLFELSKRDSVSAALQQAFGIRKYYAAGQQDMWIALAVEPGKRDGYYVDVGSADGVVHSNSYIFDRMGWKGICIDPLPTNMGSRTCQLFRQPIFSESGKKVSFRAAGENGGIIDTMNRYKENNATAPLVDFVTATLDEVLDKAKAPRHIEYVSIDVEGAELDVLRGFSLDKYQVDAFTIEHNNEPQKREAMRQLLESKGYSRVRSWVVDDWYVRQELANRYEFNLEWGFRK